jgi:hypothetical protein
MTIFIKKDWNPKNQVEQKLHVINQLLFYANDMNLLEDDIEIKEKRQKL